MVCLTQMGIASESNSELIARASEITARAVATEFEAHVSRALRQPEESHAKKMHKCVKAFATVDPRPVCKQLWEGGRAYCTSMALYHAPAAGAVVPIS